MQCGRQPLGPRPHGQDGAAHRALREPDAKLVQEAGRPDAAAQDHLAGRDAALLGDDGRYRPARGFDPARGTALHDHAAVLQDAPGNDRRGAGRVGDAVGWRPDPALPALPGGSTPLRRLRRRQHARLDALAAGKAAPPGPALDLGGVVREVEQPAPAKTQILADVAGHVFPEVQRPRRQRQFPGIAVLLPAPAPVAARLLGPHAALLEQHDFLPGARQPVGRADADDARADDHDIGCLGDHVGGVDSEQWRGHGGSFRSWAKSYHRIVSGFCHFTNSRSISFRSRLTPRMVCRRRPATRRTRKHSS